MQKSQMPASPSDCLFQPHTTPSLNSAAWSQHHCLLCPQHWHAGGNPKHSSTILPAPAPAEQAAALQGKGKILCHTIRRKTLEQFTKGATFRNCFLENIQESAFGERSRLTTSIRGGKAQIRVATPLPARPLQACRYCYLHV